MNLNGLPNLHSHTFQRAMAGLSEYKSSTQDSFWTDNFWTWREIMYKFVDNLTPDDVEAIAAFAFMEMVETGFTHVGEFHYLHHDEKGNAYANSAELSERIASAAKETGIRLTLLPVYYAQSGFKGAPPTQGQRRFINSRESYLKLLEACEKLAPTGVAPHSLRAVTLEDLNWLATLRPSAPFHIHIAEQEKEVSDCLAAHAQRPLELLFNTLDVNERFCLVHATQALPFELEKIQEAKAVVGLCPITEANLGDGLFPMTHYKGAWGVGSDSNIRISMPDELRTLEYGQRLFSKARNIISESSTGQTLYEKALKGGQQALGASYQDEVTLNTSHPNLCFTPEARKIDSFIFAGDKELIKEVKIAGKTLVQNGKHLKREAIEARYKQSLKTLLASL